MTPFYADLHIHSKFSRACSRDCDLEHLALVGRRKGISVIGTGDFTHPKWFEELESTLVSADPEMCWRVSGLDRYRLVSNSDAHSPPALGREATVLDTELDYWAIRRALETGEGFEGTVEFFPEEGKYHLDGHRKCDVRMEPAETRRNGGLCPA